jgi:putative membrane protein
VILATGLYSSKSAYPGKELHALTARPAPDPTEWAFSPRNNFLRIPSKVAARNETPTDWLRKGKAEILEALRG